MIEEVLGGYNGKVLRVNLSTNEIRSETTEELFRRKFLGGAGFVSYYLWKELRAGTDPLGPDNKLIFALGPITGVSVPGSGRNCVGAKSPLTGGIAKSEVGGFWGAELKRAGYDAVIVEGKAAKPVYLWINNDNVSIRDANHLWGKKTKDTRQVIRDELGDKLVRVAHIGPAGENLVSFACIMNGLFNAAGRGGLGAVMGSKNLKAIAVRGRKAPKIHHPERVKELRQWVLSNPQKYRLFHDLGTAGLTENSETTGNLPIRNFRDGSFPTANQISGEVIRDTIRVGMDTCFACPVRCKLAVKFEEPYSVDPAYGGPEYETLASIGSNCGIDNLKSISKGNELCNAYGLDTISLGVVLSFAMECFENGLLKLSDTDGLNLKFGNEEAMLKVIELISKRQGIGNLLADGSAKAAIQIGNGAHQFAIHVKGLEMGMHEPRYKAGQGLGYMVNPHGADHCCNMFDTMYEKVNQLDNWKPLGVLEPFPLDDIGPRKVALFKLVQSKAIIGDCLVLCSFLPYSFKQVTELTEAITGWNTDIYEQLKVAERILTLARLFNIRDGFNASDDRLPWRFFQPKTPGPLGERVCDPMQLEKAKNYYYTLMGWHPQTGIPLPEKVEELGIS